MLTETFLIVFVSLAALMFAGAVLMYLVSRRSNKVTESLVLLMTRPERAKVQDAARVLQTIMADEIEKIESNFKSMSDLMMKQIERADNLHLQLGEKNAKMIATADESARKISVMNYRLENMLSGFDKIVNSNEWASLDKAADKFQHRINDLLNKVDSQAQDTVERTREIQTHIDSWVDSGKRLSGQLQSDFETNTGQMNSMIVESDAMKEALEKLSASVAAGFEKVRSESTGYKDVMTENEKLLGSQLEKLDAFTKQSRTLLATQVNGLTDTASSVGAQIRLAESSIEKQERKLYDTIAALSETAAATEESVRNIVGEVSVLVGKWGGDVKDFTTGVVAELNEVHGVAHHTLNDAKMAAGAFSESVRTMAEGVRETLTEMNNAHTQLTGQSGELVKVSSDVTTQLLPLTELIEKYYATLPDLTKGSAELSEQLASEIAQLEEKLSGLNIAMGDSIVGIADSSLKLNNLAGESRQQMIDLMSDYAKAVDTMKTLTNQMAEARAQAPMRAMAMAAAESKAFNSAPAAPAAPAPVSAAAKAHLIPAQDFIGAAGNLIERLHELSVDLTRAVGAEIPDAVWTKYHNGDKTIFSKWFAKMLGAADKRKVRELFKQDAVFRSQTTQFVRSFAKMLAGAEQTDNKDMVVQTLLNTDLGQMYLALKAFL